MKHIRIIISAVAVSLALLTGCSAAPKAAEPAPAAATTTAAAPAEEKVDRTAAFKEANPGAAWLGSVNKAVQYESGRLQVDTSVVDPRGADGSEPAMTAVALCKAAVASFPEYANISVMEKDGTHFVLFGHPSYPNGCTEV